MRLDNATIEQFDGIDYEKALAILGNEREILIIVLESIVENLPADVATFRAAQKAGDMKNAKMSAHSIKSALRSVAADEIADMAAALEEAAFKNDEATLELHSQPFLNKISDFLDRLSSTIDNKDC